MGMTITKFERPLKSKFKSMLEIGEKELLKAYNSATYEGKRVLENLFAPDELLLLRAKEEIKTLADVYKKLCIVVHPQMHNFPHDKASFLNAIYQLTCIADVLNQYASKDLVAKYIPVFELTPIFKVSHITEASKHEFGINGRLVKFKTRELADYAANQFMNFFRTIHLQQ